jgi:2-polyprenyl-3-methyl-5-hydroxy-6-metoxy-1,4-benzoquinol methylase
MRLLDRWLQTQRIRKAIAWLRPGDRILDIGCHEGELFSALDDSTLSGVGLDPLSKPRHIGDRFELRTALFPDGLRSNEKFEVITALAVIEHVPSDQLLNFAAACRARLTPGGRFVATIPSPFVDQLLKMLLWLRLLDGMSTEQHHGLPVEKAISTFRAAGFDVSIRRSFQFGLNNLLVMKAVPN